MVAGMDTHALMIHGGAGTPLRGGDESGHRRALQQMVDWGAAALRAGAAALDVACELVVRLEDCPLFNAGCGAVLNAAGEVELDAALMDGASGRAAALALLQRARNPIRAARRLLDTPDAPLLLAGPAADAWVAAQGLECVAPDYFRTALREAQWQAWRERQGAAPCLDHDGRMGTVGAVVRDAQGRLAAATSTGGMTGKWPGRVGDSPLIGSGTYANAQVAVSCTGTGEAFIRAQAAHGLAQRLRWAGQGLREAAEGVIHEDVAAQQGAGGLIALGLRGAPVAALNTPGMYRAWALGDAPPKVAIWAEEA